MNKFAVYVAEVMSECKAVEGHRKGLFIFNLPFSQEELVEVGPMWRNINVSPRAGSLLWQC